MPILIGTTIFGSGIYMGYVELINMDTDTNLTRPGLSVQRLFSPSVEAQISCGVIGEPCTSSCSSGKKVVMANLILKAATTSEYTA